jgi:ATP-binding protein involved in chromosome partitioning
VFGRKRSLKREDVLRCLDNVAGPNAQSIVLAGLIEDIHLDEAQNLIVTIAVPKGEESAATRWQANAQEALQRLEGVGRILVVLTAHIEKPDGQAPSPPQTQRVRKGARLSDAAAAGGAMAAPSQVTTIPHVRYVIAIASAKGGVGKSTVAVNIAAALKALGLNVGLLDIDIYGPSLPTMMGTLNEEPETGSDKKLQPVIAYGLKTMSIGYMVDTDAPMIWRGPIVTSAIRQLLEDVAWGSPADPLDVLVLDTPPGTGDAQLALTQRVPLNGVVIVSTPQEVALADVRRGAAMFIKTHVPVLGIIENMAYLTQQDGTKLHVFGEGGARRTAQDLGLPFLGEVPLEKSLRESGDAGAPFVVMSPGSPVTNAFMSMAAHIYDGLLHQDVKAAPEIVFED